MYQRRYYRAGQYRGPATQRALARRRAPAYIPSDIGGYRGAPADRTGRGFRGNYSRSTAEKKYIDTTTASYNITTTGTVTLVNACNEGTGVSQRVGRKICLKSVQIRGLIDPEDGATNASLARVLLVWDKQANGVLATIAEIFAQAQATSPMNLDNRERFVVLMDKQYAVGAFDSTTGYAQSPTVHSLKKFKKFPANTFTIYDGTGAGIADINTGALLVVTLGNQAPGAGARINHYVRVRYTDS